MIYLFKNIFKNRLVCTCWCMLCGLLLLVSCADELTERGDLRTKVTISLMPEIEPMVADVATTRAMTWPGPPPTNLFDNSKFPHVKTMKAWGYDWNDTPLFEPRTEVSRDANGGDGWPILNGENGVPWPPSNIGNLHFYAVTYEMQNSASSTYTGNFSVVEDPTYDRGPTMILHNRWWPSTTERLVGESMVNAASYTNTAYMGGESQPVSMKFRHIYACIRFWGDETINGVNPFNYGVTDVYLKATSFGAISMPCWVNNKFRSGRYGHPEEDVWLPYSGTEMVLESFRAFWVSGTNSSNFYYLVPHKFPKPKEFNGYRMSSTARTDLGLSSSSNVPIGKRVYGTLPGTEWKAGYYYTYAIGYQPHGVLLYNQEEKWGDPTNELCVPVSSDINDSSGTPVFTQKDYAPMSVFDTDKRFSFALWCYEQKDGQSKTLLDQEWYFNQKYHDTGEPWPDQETGTYPVQFWAYSNGSQVLQDTVYLCGGTLNNINYPTRISGSGSYDNPPTATIDNQRYSFYYGIPDEQNYVSGPGQCQNVTLKFRHGMAELMFNSGSRNGKSLKSVRINLCEKGVFSIKEQRWISFIGSGSLVFTPNGTEWFDVIPQTFIELPVTLVYTDNSTEEITLQNISWQQGHRYVYTLL